MPDSNIPQVRDLRAKIAGLLPPHTQSRVLGGIALLMVLVIVFSGRKPTRDPHPAAPVAAASIVDPNQTRIQDYRVRIEEQTQKLAAEEAQLAETKQTLGLAPTASVRVPGSTAAESRLETEAHARGPDRSLFASNIALTYRPAHTAPAAPTAFASTAGSAGSPSGDVAPAPAVILPSETTGLTVRSYRLWEGTIFETVLTNRLDSGFSGPVNCMVTTNVYAPDTGVLVIPQGTRVLGEVRKLESMGDQRLAVFFHRLIRPDGVSVNLDRFVGLNQIGETGLRDQVNHHYVQIFGVSLAIGAIAGLAQANTRYGANESGADVYEQGVTASLAQTSTHILDRYLNVLPTFTIREGHRIKIYLSQDLMVPAYGERP